MMSDKNRKKLLLSLGAVAMVGAIIGGGTYATFNAQTKNPGNTWANGSLVLSDKVGSGTACLSTGAGTSTDTNVNNDCAKIFDRSLQKPGDSSTGQVTIKNEGTLAGVLKLASSGCTNGDVATETYKGSGNPCGKVQFFIQKTDSAGLPTECVYGATQALTPTTCDFAATGATSKTLSDYAATASVTPTSLGSLAAGGSNYYTLSVKLPADADNTYQGRKASIDFTWTLEQ